MPTPRCFICHGYGDGNVQERTLTWHVRPKKKYNIPDYDDVVMVCLCESCWECNKDNSLVGWDWWDAVDGLITPSQVLDNSPYTTN